jgi:hypothetical protein
MATSITTNMATSVVKKDTTITEIVGEVVVKDLSVTATEIMM